MVFQVSYQIADKTAKSLAISQESVKSTSFIIGSISQSYKNGLQLCPLRGQPHQLSGLTYMEQQLNSCSSLVDIDRFRLSQTIREPGPGIRMNLCEWRPSLSLRLYFAGHNTNTISLKQIAATFSYKLRCHWDNVLEYPISI